MTKTQVLGRESDADGAENYLRDTQDGDCELHGAAGASVDLLTHRRERARKMEIRKEDRGEGLRRWLRRGLLCV